MLKLACAGLCREADNLPPEAGKHFLSAAAAPALSGDKDFATGFFPEPS